MSLKALAMFRCCGRLQWFSMDRIRGYLQKKWCENVRTLINTKQIRWFPISRKLPKNILATEIWNKEAQDYFKIHKVAKGKCKMIGVYDYVHINLKSANTNTPHLWHELYFNSGASKTWLDSTGITDLNLLAAVGEYTCLTLRVLCSGWRVITPNSGLHMFAIVVYGSSTSGWLYTINTASFWKIQIE